MGMSVDNSQITVQDFSMKNVVGNCLYFILLCFIFPNKIILIIILVGDTEPCTGCLTTSGHNIVGFNIVSDMEIRINNIQ